jgi:hypothetical protein
MNETVDFPPMYRVRQVFEAPRVEDLELAIRRELESIRAKTLIRRGSRIAVTAGSRGITGIDRILRCLVAALKEMGAKPFLVPCMGSHGGGTAEGQIEVLESLGITETAIGAPIVSSVEVKEIGRSSYGFPVFVDRHAAEADGIVVVNRIKPHTEFEGPIESGLMKMMAIGMGKHRGCLEVHKQTVHYGYREVIPEIGRVILDRLPIVFGLAVVENVYDETALVRAILPGDFFKQEVQLLERAKQLMARLPFDRVDILIVDEMGKNISGTGMDSNVIGRIMFIGEPEPKQPKIIRIVVLDLTEASHGNAVGIGLADYTTRRLVTKMDQAVTATNAITAMTPEKGRIPIALKTDREAVNAAFTTIGAVEPRRARVVHIRNTLAIAEMDVAEVFLNEIAGRRDLEILREVGPLAFDQAGNLLSEL